MAHLQFSPWAQHSARPTAAFVLSNLLVRRELSRVPITKSRKCNPKKSEAGYYSKQFLTDLPWIP